MTVNFFDTIYNTHSPLGNLVEGYFYFNTLSPKWGYKKLEVLKIEKDQILLVPGKKTTSSCVDVALDIALGMTYLTLVIPAVMLIGKFFVHHHSFKIVSTNEDSTKPIQTAAQPILNSSRESQESSTAAKPVQILSFNSMEDKMTWIAEQLRENWEAIGEAKKSEIVQQLNTLLHAEVVQLISKLDNLNKLDNFTKLSLKENLPIKLNHQLRKVFRELGEQHPEQMIKLMPLLVNRFLENKVLDATLWNIIRDLLYSKNITVENKKKLVSVLPIILIPYFDSLTIDVISERAANQTLSKEEVTNDMGFFAKNAWRSEIPSAFENMSAQIIRWIASLLSIDNYSTALPEVIKNKNHPHWVDRVLAFIQPEQVTGKYRHSEPSLDDFKKCFIFRTEIEKLDAHEQEQIKDKMSGDQRLIFDLPFKWNEKEQKVVKTKEDLSKLDLNQIRQLRAAWKTFLLNNYDLGALSLEQVEAYFEHLTLTQKLSSICSLLLLWKSNVQYARKLLLKDQENSDLINNLNEDIRLNKKNYELISRNLSEKELQTVQRFKEFIFSINEMKLFVIPDVLVKEFLCQAT